MAVESVDELSVEAEKLSFLNGVCVLVVDISLFFKFLIMIFVFLFCKSAIFPALKITVFSFCLDDITHTDHLANKDPEIGFSAVL